MRDEFDSRVGDCASIVIMVAHFLGKETETVRFCLEALRKVNMSVFTINHYGEQVPAIPIPWKEVGVSICPKCRQAFLKNKTYKKHFVVRHIYRGVI